MQGPNIIRPVRSVFAIDSTLGYLNRTRSRRIAGMKRIGRRLNGSKHINWRRRRSLTRVLAAGASLGLYCMSTLAVTGALMTATSTTAEARRWSWLPRWSRLPRWPWLARQPPLGLPSPSLEQRTPLLLGLVDQAVLVKRLRGGCKPAVFLLFRAVCLETPSQIPNAK